MAVDRGGAGGGVRYRQPARPVRYTPPSGGRVPSPQQVAQPPTQPVLPAMGSNARPWQQAGYGAGQTAWPSQMSPQYAAPTNPAVAAYMANYQRAQAARWTSTAPNGAPASVPYSNVTQMNQYTAQQRTNRFNQQYPWAQELASPRVYDAAGNMTMGPGRQVWGQPSYMGTTPAARPPSTPTYGGYSYEPPTYPTNPGGGGGGYMPEWWQRMLVWNFG